LYAAILVSAMALDSTDVAMMIPGVRLSAIRRASMLLARRFTLCLKPFLATSAPRQH
jgi:hypothetical protein